MDVVVKFSSIVGIRKEPLNYKGDKLIKYNSAFVDETRVKGVLIGKN